MCNVCCATQALEAATLFRWIDGPSALGLEVEARGEGPEFKPAKFRFRRHEDPRPSFPSKGAPWTPWIETRDLAGAMSRLGVDVKWMYVDAAVKAYLRGEGPVQHVEVLAADQRTGGRDGRN